MLINQFVHFLNYRGYSSPPFLSLLGMLKGIWWNNEKSGGTWGNKGVSHIFPSNLNLGMRFKLFHTKNNRYLCYGSWERIIVMWLWSDDECTMHCRAHPRDMCMPKKCTALTSDCEVIEIALARLNGALCDICRAIEPCWS